MSGNAVHGDTITVQVTPNDGTLNGSTVTSAAVSILDTAPVIDTVSIAPSAPTIGSVLTANVTSFDADGDTVTYSYQWYNNGTAISGATNATLTVSGNAVHGNVIMVQVTPKDGMLNGKPFVSAPVTIGDTAPVLDTVSITPSNPTISDTLTANVSSHDPDGDTVSYSYQWYKNGTTISGATNATLTVSGNAVHGDTITVQVTPKDGTLSGSAVTSAAVTIQDTAPVISSVTITPSSPTIGSVLTANVSSSDADGDSVSYSYKWFDGSSAIAGATSATLTVSGNAVHGDTITVQVTPKDGTLSGSAVTSAAVTIHDTAPVISSVTITPSSPTIIRVLTANVSSSDDDGDSVTYSYKWYDGSTAIAGATSATLAVSGNAVHGDTITVRSDAQGWHLLSGSARHQQHRRHRGRHCSGHLLGYHYAESGPTISSVLTQPTSAVATPTATALHTATSGTTEVAALYRGQLPDATLTVSGNAVHGHNITVQVTPNDGFQNGQRCHQRRRHRGRHSPGHLLGYHYSE